MAPPPEPISGRVEMSNRPDMVSHAAPISMVVEVPTQERDGGLELDAEIPFAPSVPLSRRAVSQGNYDRGFFVCHHSTICGCLLRQAESV
jgi:hypothetical protein